MRSARLLLAGLVLAGLGATSLPAGAAPTARWIAAWAAPITDSAVATLGGSGPPSEATVRNIAYVTLGGTKVRIRVSNAFGEQPLVIGSATVAIRTEGAAVDPRSIRRVTFRGKTGVTVPPKTDAVYSDAVAFPVKAHQLVAVSLSLPSESNPAASAANYNTSYQSAAGSGDRTRDADGEAFTGTMGSTYALTAIDVLTTEADGAIVGLGSSSFHGTASTRDTYGRVLDLLSVRAKAFIAAGRRKSVISAGIGGDTLNASLARLDRDVLTQTGVSGVMIYNINDIGQRRTAEQIIADYRTVIRRAHARRVLAFCPTWPPAAQSMVGRPTEERSKVNAWILNSGECDGVVDWNEVLADAATGETYRAQYFADAIHPNDAGHRAMAEATPLRWFTARFPG